MTITLAFIFGYLLGSVPFGLILTRAAGGPDLRTIGSGNIGATNVLRTGRKTIAAATLVCDMLKGTAAVWVTRHYLSDSFGDVSSYFSVYSFAIFVIAVYLAAFGAFLGHLFPIWLKFKGGKGVATYIGILLGIYWPGALIFCAIWLIVAAVSRYSSLAALIASALTLFALWRLFPPNAVLFLPLTVLLWIMHRANIVRLLKGSEDKIGLKQYSPYKTLD